MAAAIGAVLGGGGLRVASRLFAPEIAKYYREVIDGLEHEARVLRERVVEIEEHRRALERDIEKIVLGEGPAELA
jgi:hypothetical protein